MNYIETICIKDNVAQNIEYHMARMRQNSAVNLPNLSSLNTLSGRVKCRILYNSSSIVSIEFSPYKLPDIQTLKVVESSSIIYDKKHEDRSALSALYAKRENCDDIIICKNGNISDSYFCNIVFSRDGKLFTPDAPLLHGTKRQKLIDNGTITPQKITRDDIAKYEGIHLINAMIDLADNIYIPITNLDF